ncbi:MAG: hypothetical protein ACQESK_02080 [Bacteroidota bacterium]
MKNKIVFLLIATLMTSSIYAQLDGAKNSSKSLDMRKSSGKSFPSTNLGIPNRNNGDRLEREDNEGVTFEEEKEFTNPSDLHEDRLNKQFEENGKEPRVRDEFKNDMDFGEFRTSSGKITIACRDHMTFDGDRVQIKLNGEVIVENVLLENQFKSFVIELEEGFNKIEFIALNQGNAGPNTAELVVFDENGDVMTKNVWNLLTGVKAFALVVKEVE